MTCSNVQSKQPHNARGFLRKPNKYSRCRNLRPKPWQCGQLSVFVWCLWPFSQLSVSKISTSKHEQLSHTDWAESAVILFKEPRIMGLVISLFGCGVSVNLPECLNEASGFTMKLYPPCVSNSRWLKLRPAIWLTLFSSLIDKKSFKPLNTHGYITSHCS